MTFLDTSALVDSLTGARRSIVWLRGALDAGERLAISSLVLYEWLRGPRSARELTAQEELFPSESAVPFGPEEAAVTAKLYRSLPKPRGREMDLAIAACAITREASLWTLNRTDFGDIPGLRLTILPASTSE